VLIKRKGWNIFSSLINQQAKESTISATRFSSIDFPITVLIVSACCFLDSAGRTGLHLDLGRADSRKPSLMPTAMLQSPTNRFIVEILCLNQDLQDGEIGRIEFHLFGASSKMETFQISTVNFLLEGSFKAPMNVVTHLS
jgi:hypothetical protein